VAVTPELGPGNGPLTGVHVRFDQPVNLLPVAFNAYLESNWTDGALPSVTLTDLNGNSAPLRLESYDDDTNTPNFVLLSGLPSGVYFLGLSGDGRLGVTSLSGAPLAGNVALPGAHKFLTMFRVSGAAGITNTYTSQPGNDDLAHAQQLGV